MKVYSLLILIVFISLFSCKKNKAIDEESYDIEETLIYAGKPDSTLFTYTFQTPISIEVVYDSMNLYGYGTTAVDLDFNGSTDITFSLNLINHDNIYLLNGSMPVPSPNCSAITSNNVSIVMIKDTLMINGSPSIISWCDTVEYGNLINQNLNWSETATELYLWEDIDGVSTGNWMMSEGIKYLGFKLNEKYGWLAIDVTNFQNPKLIEFAVQR